MAKNSCCGLRFYEAGYNSDDDDVPSTHTGQTSLVEGKCVTINTAGYNSEDDDCRRTNIDTEKILLVDKKYFTSKTDPSKCKEGKDDDPRTHTRLLWSIGSTSGGKYVSVKKGDMETESEVTVTAKGESDDTSGDMASKSTIDVTGSGESDNDTDIVKIKFVKYICSENMKKTVQPWFYLKFSSASKVYTVSASKDWVKASDQKNTSGTLFQIFSLYSPNDSYVVVQSDQKNDDGNPLYLSSNGAGNMKLKVWNSPIPGPPHTTDQVDPALLFRLVRPFGEKK